jgi:putative addiction module component (TIGR02574 family)
MAKVSLTAVLELSIPERIQLVEDIWDSLVEIPSPVVLTGAQREELDRRFDDYHQHPHDGISWDSLKSLILGR